MLATNYYQQRSRTTVWLVAVSLSLPIGLFVTGCSSRTLAAERQEQQAVSRSINQQNLDFQVASERKLAEVANSIDRSLAELAAIERTRTPPNKKLVSMDNSELQNRTVTLDWNGPIAPLVHRVAKLVGYRVRILGRVPAVPILVSVSGHEMPAADLLRDADLQCGKRARIALFSKAKVIELRYYE